MASVDLPTESKPTQHKACHLQVYLQSVMEYIVLKD